MALVALEKITLIIQKIHRFNKIVLAKLFNIREHIFRLFTVLSKPKQIKEPKKGGLLKKVKIWENIKMQNSLKFLFAPKFLVT